MSSTTFSSSFLREINENFLGMPIYTLNSYCYKPIVLGYWAGTSDGCDCRGIYDDDIPYPNQFNKGSCNSNETRAHCVNYHSKSPIDIIKYEGFSFCNNTDKDVLEYKHYLNNSVSKNEECGFGFKSCGYLDTLDQKLCIKINEECPINDLYINSVQDAPKDYNTITLNNNKYLHYTNKNNSGHIITRLKLSEDNQPCIYPGEFSWKYHYILEKQSGYCKTLIESQKYDTRYIKIDKINKYDLYYENDIIRSIRNLPLYNFTELKLDTIYLYKRTFLGFEKKCMKENKFSFEYFDSIRDKQLTSRTFITINLILLLTIVELFFILFLLKKEEEEVIISTFRDCDYCLLRVILVICFIGVGLLNLLSYLKLGGIEINFNCGDHLTNSLFQELKKVIEFNKSSNNIVNIFTIIVILINICFFVFIKCYVKNKYNHKAQDNNYLENSLNDNNIDQNTN